MDIVSVTAALILAAAAYLSYRLGIKDGQKRGAGGKKTAQGAKKEQNPPQMTPELERMIGGIANILSYNGDEQD